MSASKSTLPTLLQRFFCEYLIQQRRVSPHTVAAYRDTMRLLLCYLKERLGRLPSDLLVQDIDGENIAAFLNHCENVKGNGIRTRNARLAAIRTFLKYAILYEPATVAQAQAGLAIPFKRHDKPVLGYLTETEMRSVIDAPDVTRWSGRRDRLLFSTMYSSGARVSEIISACVGEFDADGAGRLVLHGKGRKERIVPLLKRTIRDLRDWRRDYPRPADAPLFPNASGGRMSRSGAAKRLAKAVAKGGEVCPSLAQKRVTPHTIRHTTAMHLLQAGVEMSVIALWLGHEDIATTHGYITSDLKMKEKALGALHDTPGKRQRFQPGDRLLRFLEGL